VAGAERALKVIVDKIESAKLGEELLIVVAAPRSVARRLPAAGARRFWIRGGRALGPGTSKPDPAKLGGTGRAWKTNPDIAEIYAKYDAGDSQQYVRIYRNGRVVAPERTLETLTAQLSPSSAELVAWKKLPTEDAIAPPPMALTMVLPGRGATT